MLCCLLLLLLFIQHFKCPTSIQAPTIARIVSQGDKLLSHHGPCCAVFADSWGVMSSEPRNQTSILYILQSHNLFRMSQLTELDVLISLQL